MLSVISVAAAHQGARAEVTSLAGLYKCGCEINTGLFLVCGYIGVASVFCSHHRSQRSGLDMVSEVG